MQNNFLCIFSAIKVIAYSTVINLEDFILVLSYWKSRIMSYFSLAYSFFFNLYHFISNDMYSPAPLFALFFLSKLFKKKDHLFGLVLISFLFSFWKKRQPLLLWFAHMVSFGLTWVKWFQELVLIFENFLLKLKLLYK